MKSSFFSWFLNLAKIGSLSFGGSGRQALFLDFLVVRKRWVSEEMFFQNVTFANFLPGPNVVNLTLLLGLHIFHSLTKALLCVLALTLPGALLGLSLVTFLPQNPQVDLLFRGFSIASVALAFPFFARMVSSAFPKTLRNLEVGYRAILTLVVITASVYGLELKWILFVSLSIALSKEYLFCRR